MARYDVALTSSAEKELKKLPGQWIARIVPRLENLASNPRPPGCKKLRGGNREWRFRVGYYRVVYTIDDSELLVEVTRIRHRSEVCER
jgi:mRNA interferase RelE/StbE